jgi:cytochrome c553
MVLRQFRRSYVRCCVATYVIAVGSASAAEGQASGERIYAAKCTVCHGVDGNGVDDNGARLEGDLSVAQLADLIGETMPEDDPGTLSDDESREVAAYVHEAFYSPIARARNRPARIELARLTVRQYRRAVADLIGSFSRRATWSEERGLRGEYFASRQPGGDKQRKGRQIDANVDFDFGAEAPLPEIEEPRVFSIRWTGSVLPPETGEYEFIVRTEHAARLWVNDHKQPLIDAWVKSGGETEYRASRFLINGQPYALRLEFSKAKQGVDDSDKQKEKPPSAPASIALSWRRPGGAAEPIPSRRLSPESSPEAFVCTTPFPPDDRSYGWERGVAVSQAWDEATTGAALETLDYVVANLNRLAGTGDDEKRAEKLRVFCERFVEGAFRRPLDDELRELCVDRQFDAAADVDAAVRRVVLLALKSPRFLFREPGGGSEPYDVAARLSFGLWDSIPDRELLAAAASGRLTTCDDVRRQAERIIGDVRAQTKLKEFLLTWLRVDAPAELNKDPEVYPEFDAAVVADLRTSLELFLEEVLASEAADYRELLLSDEVYLNERLSQFYRGAPGDEPGFGMVRLDDGQRAGVLTHPYVMSRFAYHSETSPIHRGVFLARGVLGRRLKAPPEAFTPLAAELHPELTTRERVTLQTKPAQCMGCHAIINPLGFTLEQFDAVGRFRDRNREKPVNAAAAYEAPDGTTVELGDARDLAEYLVASEDCHAAFAEQLFHHLVQQSVDAFGPTTLDELRASFATHDYNIRRLAVEIMVATALVGRETGIAAGTGVNVE